VSDLDGNLGEFLDETYENLGQLDLDFVAIEANPDDRSNLLGITRTLHSLKGTCGFFGFTKLEALAHAGEDLLQRLRDEPGESVAGSIDALLALVDAIRRVLAQIEKTREEGDEDYSALIHRVTRKGSLDRGADVGLEWPISPVELRIKEEVLPSEVPLAETQERVDELASGTVRISVGLLDQLMDMSGELVLARNQLMQFAATSDDPRWLGALGRMSQITTEVQASVMKARMQPIGTIWNRFPRLVRDLAQACGKKAVIEFDGRETELDRAILEAIKDPLTHAIRNAVDHGIESPRERELVKKRPEGHLLLRAAHESGRVQIELRDDGRGIDPELIRQKMAQRGLATREMLDRMNDSEVLRLLFLPGFSTSESVTSVSGRGVGMDVVKSNVERIGGSVEIRSRVREGTSVLIVLPLTLAVIPSLIVGQGRARYAIPQVAIRELVRLDGQVGARRIESFHGAPVFRLRGDLLPLLDLGRMLDQPGPELVQGEQALSIAVIQVEGLSFGLLVDRFHDIEEVVVKSLGRHLREIDLYSGATILGDGGLAIILDVAGLARRAGLTTKGESRRTIEEGEAEKTGQAEPEIPSSFLLFDPGRGGRMAIPIEQVARIEEISVLAVEKADGQEVLLHDGRLIPVIRSDASSVVQPESRQERLSPLKVIVCHAGGRWIGLVVDAIHDIVQTRVQIHHSEQRRGILGAAVIEGRTTDLLDLPGLIEVAAPRFFAQKPTEGATATRREPESSHAQAE